MEAGWNTVRYVWTSMLRYCDATSKDAERVAKEVLEGGYSHSNMTDEFGIPKNIAVNIISEIKNRINESREAGRDSF